MNKEEYMKTINSEQVGFASMLYDLLTGAADIEAKEDYLNAVKPQMRNYAALVFDGFILTV